MNTQVKKNIEKQEKKDRYVAEQCLKEIFKNGRDLRLYQTSIYDYVDLKGSVLNENNQRVFFNVEIKERNKKDWQIKKYPQAELKVDKYKRMKSVTPKNIKLLYMVLLNNEECILFDMSKIDWNLVQTVNWEIKATEMDPDSPIVSTPTYLFPYNQAVARIDCRKYFEEYTTSISWNTDNNFTSTITNY